MSIINPVFIVRVQSFECLSVVFIFMQVGKSFSNSFWEGSKKEFCSVQSLVKGAKVVFRKQSDIFVVILPLVKTWRSRQEIRFGVRRAWFVKEFKMILLEFCEPASLAAINLLWLAEILEVLMIRPYFERFCCANKVVSPFFKSEHYGKHLFIVYLVVSLSLGKSFREVCDWMPFVVLQLRQNCTDSVVAAVGFEAKL